MNARDFFISENDIYKSVCMFNKKQRYEFYSLRNHWKKSIKKGNPIKDSQLLLTMIKAYFVKSFWIEVLVSLLIINI